MTDQADHDGRNAHYTHVRVQRIVGTASPLDLLDLNRITNLRAEA